MKTEPETKVTFRLPVKEAKRFEAVLEQTGTSRSWVLRKLLAEFLDRNEKKQEK